MLALRPAGYGDPDVARLVAEVQQEYVRRYGGTDENPIDPAEFAPPSGLFLVGYERQEPVAMGGWRAYALAHGGPVPGRSAAEIRRMFVVPAARGRGHARALLAELERTAAAAGHDWLVLETGLAQPEAIALYRSAGYVDVEKFGYYRHSHQAVHLGKPLTLTP